MDRLWSVFERQCRERWADDGMVAHPDWPEFSSRLDAEFRRLAELLWELYRDRPDFALQTARLVEDIFRAYHQRPEALRERDRTLAPESYWFGSGSQVGAVAYVDLYAGSFRGVAARIPAFKELGVTYLHLMPFFMSPMKENDGGYAVSSYRDTNPALGSMEDLENLSQTLADEGIALVADFVFNHTSDEHPWAKQAKAGDLDHQEFYWVFNDKADTAVYQASLRDIFPEVRKGSFTWCPDMG
jgi:amylosucrase